MSLRTTFGGHSLARKSRAERRSISCSSEKAKSMMGLESVRPAVRRAGGALWAPQWPPARAGLKLFSTPLFGLVLETARDQASVVGERARRALRVQGPKSLRTSGPLGEVQQPELAWARASPAGLEAVPAKWPAAVALRSSVGDRTAAGRRNRSVSPAPRRTWRRRGRCSPRLSWAARIRSGNVLGPADRYRRRPDEAARPAWP